MTRPLAAASGLLLALLAACAPSAERTAADRKAIEDLLADYAARLTRAYESGDAAALAEVATGREIKRVEVRIAELAEGGRGLRPRLVRMAVDEIEAQSGTTATATTIETWDLRMVALGSEEKLGESTGQENRVVYTLMREQGRWWVISRLLRSTNESP